MAEAGERTWLHAAFIAACAREMLPDCALRKNFTVFASIVTRCNTVARHCLSPAHVPHSNLVPDDVIFRDVILSAASQFAPQIARAFLLPFQPSSPHFFIGATKKATCGC